MKKQLKQRPAFVYLSDVLQQYAGKGNLLRLDNDDSEPEAIFGRFLARLIKSGTVLLFDVHTLKLAENNEVADITEYLQHYSADVNHPLNVGISYGLDFCVDADRLSVEVKRTGKLPRLECRSVLARLKPTSKKFPVTPAVSVDTSLDPDSWSLGCKVAVPPTFIEFQLSKGRHEDAMTRANLSVTTGRKILRRKGKPETPTTSQPRDCSEYRGAKKQEYFPYDGWDDWYYLIGKFNFSGHPALFLENVEVFDPQKTVGPRKHPAGSKLAKRAEELQQQLDALYLSGPHKEKSHRTLCEILAEQRKIQSPLSRNGKGVKSISADTIRRETTDPGKRKRGGSRPRSNEASS